MGTTRESVLILGVYGAASRAIWIHAPTNTWHIYLQGKACFCDDNSGASLLSCYVSTCS